MNYDGSVVAFCGMDRIRTAMVFDYIKSKSREPRRIAKRFNISELQARNIVKLYDKRQKEREQFYSEYTRL